MQVGTNKASRQQFSFQNHRLRFQRENAIKKWRRDWKHAHIESANLQWRDLHEDIV
jgi:predicted GIY-YIG superfamily endonuclease